MGFLQLPLSQARLASGLKSRLQWCPSSGKAQPARPAKRGPGRSSAPERTASSEPAPEFAARGLAPDLAEEDAGGAGDSHRLGCHGLCLGYSRFSSLRRCGSAGSLSLFCPGTAPRGPVVERDAARGRGRAGARRAGRGKREPHSWAMQRRREAEGGWEARHKHHESKALRTRGTSASPFRWQRVCQVLKDSDRTGGGGLRSSLRVAPGGNFSIKGRLFGTGA